MTKTEAFITKARQVHGLKYLYEKTIYVKSKQKVLITCFEHGDFEQLPNSHLNGSGCPSCGKNKQDSIKKLSVQNVMRKCIETHGDTYDYSLVKFNKVSDKVSIVCKEHGVFQQSLINHYRGHGCPSCGKKSMGDTQKMSKDTFIKKSRKVHGNKYEYDLSMFKDYRSKIKILCKKHGWFTQSAENHYSSGAGCPSCAGRSSKGETEIFELLKSLGFDCHRSDRKTIKPLELDIVIPDLKIAIEYNGLIWHSESYGKDRWYHYNKTEQCERNGYRLIHIWENDWNNNKELQIEFLKHQLNVSEQEKVYARKCKFEYFNNCIIKDFLRDNHIQGPVSFSKAVCLTYDGELVSVSCFTRRGDEYELVRHCTSKKVIGALGKSVKRFVNINKCEVYTFLDNSRFTGVSYEKAGFELESELPPDYSYTLNGRRYHKFNFRRDQIAKKHPEVYSEELTEKEMMLKAGYSRIWDCGKKKYVFRM